MLFLLSISFCFDITTTNEIYTLSLHDALPISDRRGDVPCLPGLPGRPAGLLPGRPAPAPARPDLAGGAVRAGRGDRKSTRLNSSHTVISYAVFCLKKKKNV